MSKENNSDQIFWVEYIEEICCEECNNIVHCHLEYCPSCEESYAGTSISDSMPWFGKLSCEECDAEFEILGEENKSVKLKLLSK